jgi:hypothetical protein
MEVFKHCVLSNEQKLTGGTFPNYHYESIPLKVEIVNKNDHLFDTIRQQNNMIYNIQSQLNEYKIRIQQLEELVDKLKK